MTREQFIERFHHEILGILLDAVTKERDGTTTSWFMKLAREKVDATLGKAFDSLQHPKTEPPRSPPEPPKPSSTPPPRTNPPSGSNATTPPPPRK